MLGKLESVVQCDAESALNLESCPAKETRSANNPRANSLAKMMNDLAL
jgi:hypothetical protein